MRGLQLLWSMVLHWAAAVATPRQCRHCVFRSGSDRGAGEAGSEAGQEAVGGVRLQQGASVDERQGEGAEDRPRGTPCAPSARQRKDDGQSGQNGLGTARRGEWTSLTWTSSSCPSTSATSTGSSRASTPRSATSACTTRWERGTIRRCRRGSRRTSNRGCSRRRSPREWRGRRESAATGRRRPTRCRGSTTRPRAVSSFAPSPSA